MTLKLLFDNALKELSKVNAPSMLLEDFNYFINKAIQSYINRRYNLYDINQQTSDDLRVLKSTAILEVKPSDSYNLNGYTTGIAGLFKCIYEVELPPDYMHMLNCIVVYQINGGNYKCYNDGDYVLFAATRLTADSWSTIVNDYYNRPLPQRPYYYIHNVNAAQTEVVKDDDGNDKTVYTGSTLDKISTNPYNDDDYYDYDNEADGSLKDGTDMDENKYSMDLVADKDNDGNAVKIRMTGRSNFRRKIKLNNGKTIDAVDRETAFRYGNASKVRCEIRFGNDDSVFKPEKVLVDYIKAPQFYRLTQEQIDLTRDTSMVLEFPDYQCYEIVNELVTILMENTADPRLQTHPIVSQSIANPVQQLTPQITVPATQQATNARAAATS